MANFLLISVLILPLVYAVDPLPSISVASGCSKNGKLYKEGESFQPTPCEHCFCNGGKVICAIADCFMPTCVDAVHDPTKCCSVCPNGRNCYAGDTIIQAGKSVQIDDHTTCHCPTRFGFGMTALRAVCEIRVNTVTAKVVNLTCRRADKNSTRFSSSQYSLIMYTRNLLRSVFVIIFITVVNSLTFPQPPTPPSGCFRDGKMHPEGSHWKVSPCEWCDCVNGQSQCLIADCFIVECVDSVQHPDKCCPVCPNGKNCYFGNKIIAAGKDVQVDSHTSCRCPEQFGFGMTAHKAVCNYTMTTVKP
ncbi:kielin/chordin-like protein [Mytilus trossulus]|uniref:kielin/chordin-like protein n=1 Tax=Mytilus trossulus TaxID=6551 RepID=UPI003003B383